MYLSSVLVRFPIWLLWSTHYLDSCYWGNSNFPLVVHQPASSSIWPAVPSLQCGISKGENVVRTWMQLKRHNVCECVLQRGHIGDGCGLASTLCKYNLRKGGVLIVLS